MDLSKVMAIAGKSGLFRIISQTQGSVIVESLVDGKKMPVFATHRSSVLEDISMFTMEEDVPLKKVLWSIYQKEDGKQSSVSPKADNKTLKEYFEEILPDYDQDRVYASDIKKVLSWYNLLLEHDMISEPEEEKQESEENASDPSVTEGEKKENTEKENNSDETSSQAGGKKA